MDNYCKGDALYFDYHCKDAITGEKIKFNGKKIIALIYDPIQKDLYIKKEFNTTEEQTELTIEFSSEEMKDIKCRRYILEVKHVLSPTRIITPLQEELFVCESWCLYGK